MTKTIKIFDEDKVIYERNLPVNISILKGRLSKNPIVFGETVHFTLEISNGKDTNKNEWRIPTYANCTVFGDLGNKILRLYKERDEIFVVCKFYSNTKDEKTYKGFIVRDVINLKENDFEKIKTDDEDLPF